MKPATQMFKADPKIDEVLGIEREPKPEPIYGEITLRGAYGGAEVLARFCKRCGALVGDKRTHEAWHEDDDETHGITKAQRCGVIVPGRSDHPCVLDAGHEASQPKGQRNHEDRTGYQWSAMR